jgi:hypothetical protein
VQLDPGERHPSKEDNWIDGLMIVGEMCRAMIRKSALTIKEGTAKAVF